MSSETLASELRSIADTIERNGGWHIAAVKVRGAADRIERLSSALTSACLGGRAQAEYAGLPIPPQWVADAEALLGIVHDTPRRRLDAEALEAVPNLRDKKAVVLYFETAADRDELVAAIHSAKPGMRAVKL